MHQDESYRTIWLSRASWLTAALALSLTGVLASPLAGVSAPQKNSKNTQKQALTPEQQAAAAEAADYGALVNDFDLDHQLQSVDAFAKKYPNSQRLTYVYFIGANIERQKNNPQAAIDYAEKSLKLKPDNFGSMVLLAQTLPQPQVLKDQPDKGKVLTEAETDANQVLQILATSPNAQFPKQPNDTDDAFAKRKSMLTADLHFALGMVHLQRAQEGLQGLDKEELAKAEQEFQASVTGTDQPDPTAYYRYGETLNWEGKIDQAIAAFSKCSELSQGTAMQPLADKEVQQLKAKKAASQAPPKQ